MVDDPDTARPVRRSPSCAGGTLHIVDFGDMAGLPGWFRRAMAAWLAKFHVRHRPEVEAILSQLATEHAARGELVEILGRYALLQRLHLPLA